jgi:hypothetical protein
MRPPTTAARRRQILDRLEAELNDTTLEGAYKYARKRCRLLARCGLPIEAGLHKHLVTDAVTDTALGDVDWDPERSSLRNHLCSVVRFRTKDMLARARALPHDRICSRPDGNGEDGWEANIAGQASCCGQRSTPASSVMLDDLAAQVVGRLYAAAGQNDDDVLRRILDAYREGMSGRKPIAEHLGISLKAFDAARNRLDRLLTKLPDELARNATDLLGVAQ